MVFLCFVLNLRSLPPPVLRDVKQSLLQLANYYAVSRSKICNKVDETQWNSKPLLDRIGLCYVVRNRINCSDELKIAYNPHGNFNLRDLHHALNNFPTDAFSPESSESESLCTDMKLADVLSEKIIYTWGGHDKNVARKVVWISSCFVGVLDSVTMKALTNSLCWSKHQAALLADNVNHFVKQICSLSNCSFQTCVPDEQVLYGLNKRWLQELNDDTEEPLQAQFVFKTNLISTLNKISCNLCTSFIPIVDEFDFCQTCGCHGIPLDNINTSQTKRYSSCPVTDKTLGAPDIVENSVRVGEQTILYMPSFLGCSKLKLVSSPIDFNVIQRVNLGSLSEGLILGATHYVTPTSYNSNENNSELNCQLFQVVCQVLHSLDQGLVCSASCNIETATETSFMCYYILLPSDVFQVVCQVLHSLDQGLVCSASCNIETATETSFMCYYILLPSDGGLMLLRRLSASEEFLPTPDVSKLISSVVSEEIQNSVQASLIKVEVSDYNPVQHERGFHKKLNTLVKESLQFGAILPKSKEVISGSDLDLRNSEVQPSSPAAAKLFLCGEPPQSDTRLGEKKTGPCLTEEWEKLIVTELGEIHSPTCISNSKVNQLLTSPSQSNKQLDEKTSRILERLEIPRQLKRKAVSPTMTCSLSADVCGPVKKPLIPYRTSDGADQGPIPSQPIKPTFQRLKRKK